ncbi:hypothetical protein D3C79_909630 [compost metagenome]
MDEHEDVPLEVRRAQSSHFDGEVLVVIASTGGVVDWHGDARSSFVVEEDDVGTAGDLALFVQAQDEDVEVVVLGSNRRIPVQHATQFLQLWQGLGQVQDVCRSVFVEIEHDWTSHVSYHLSSV